MPITANSNVQHFSVTGTATVQFFRVVQSLLVTVPVGATVTMDFDDQAAKAGVPPMLVLPGTYQFNIGLGQVTIVAGGATVTGAGICY